MKEMPTLLLVHGSWHGPWCFEKLIPALSRNGASAVAVALPSVGDDIAALGDLKADAEAVEKAAAAIDGPVVVLAHSYGGAVISQARFGDNVERLVFLAAFMPDTGRNYVSYLPPGPLPPYVGLRDDGTFAVPEGQAIDAFYLDCTPEDREWAQALLRPQSQAVLGHVTDEASWRGGLPSTYIVTTQDHALPPDFQRMFAAQAGDVRDFDSSHSPFISRPDAFAALLGDIVQSHRSNGLRRAG